MGFIKRVAAFGFGGLVGGGIGAAVASVLAPQSGSQLQGSVHGVLDEARTNGDIAKAATERELIEKYRRKVNDASALAEKTGATS